MAEPIFTDFRRELLARTMFDLLKIAIGAALASKFFYEFTRPIQWGIGAAIVLLIVSGVLTCPPKKPKE